MRRLGWWLGAAAALALASPAAIFVHASWRGNQLTRRSPSLIDPKGEAEARAELPGLESVELHTSDGLRLRGWLSPGQNRAAVILVHGGGGNRLALLPEARILARHGYGVLLYDSRAQGESDGARVTWGDREQRDLSAALDLVSKRPEIDPGRIAVLGFSIGGSTASLTAARDPRARAVILHATWSSLEDEVHYNFAKYGWLSWWPALIMIRRAGVDLANVRPIDHIQEIAPRPLLMIAGAADTDTPVPVMQRLFSAAGEPKQLWIEPGATHGSYVAPDPTGYEAHVIGFLDAAFSLPGR